MLSSCGASFSTCCREAFKVRYYGLWNPTQREQSVRAWVLLILASPADAVQTPKITSPSQAFGQLLEAPDLVSVEVGDHNPEMPRCPYCGSHRTAFLGEFPPSGVP